jgi:hypothetical protein
VNPEKSSYLARCQQWLAQTPDVAAQTLVETIEKFTVQLESLTAEREDVAEDLMATLDLLNDALMRLESDDLAAQSVTAAASSPVQETPTDAGFDSSSLQCYDEDDVEVLTPQERQQRLAQLLSTQGITKGMPGS